MTDSKAESELDQIRRILLGPIEDANAARDERILNFIKAETTASAERLDRMEARLSELAALVENSRRSTLSELGRAIEDLAAQPKRHAEPRSAGPNAGELHGNVQALAATRNSR
jgi:hypothetical protein